MSDEKTEAQKLEEYRRSIAVAFRKGDTDPDFCLVTQMNNDRKPFDLKDYVVSEGEAVPGLRYSYADASDPFHKWFNWPKNVYVVREEGVFALHGYTPYLKDCVRHLSDGTSCPSGWDRPNKMVLMKNW